MHIHVFQHVPFEGPAAIVNWAEDRDHTLEVTRLYEDQPLPALDSFDMLVSMGGPMGIYDSEQYPWLERERNFIRQSIDWNKWVVGVCLGAQQIAAALGAKVSKNTHREIGWFPIFPVKESSANAWSTLFKEQSTVFHWHGDTFAIPDGAERIASSEACENQAFVYRDRVLALQFHLEATPESLTLLVENCLDELDGSRYVQEAYELLGDNDRYRNINQLLYQLLDKLVSNV